MLDLRLSFHYCSQDEPEVHGECCQQAIVLGHNGVAFFERCLVIGCCHAFVEIVGYGLWEVDAAHASALNLFHAAYAPVKISRESVGEIVVWGYGTADVEGLMADEHAVLEGMPCHVVGWVKTAWTDVLSLIINYVGIAVDEGRVGGLSLQCYMCECVCGWQGISCVEEA